MKKYLILILLCAIAIGNFSCSRQGEEKIVKSEITTLLKDFWKSYREKNIDKIMAAYAEDPSAMVVAGLEDIADNRAGIKERYQIDFTYDWTYTDFEFKDIKINYSGDVAWLATHITAKGTFHRKPFESDGRMIAVLKKIDDKWKFVMTNFQNYSVPMPAQGNETNNGQKQG